MRDGLRVLADLVDRVEAGEVTVRDASLGRSDGAGFDVSLSVHIPDGTGANDATRGSPAETESVPGERSGGTTAGEAGSVTEGDTEALGARSVAVGGALGDALRPVRTERTDGQDHPSPDRSSSDDEQIECRVGGCEETFDTEHGMKIHATKAHREADGSGPSPHRDPERLREVYGTCETFQEMTEALGVDVTSQTVRRSMMSLGIHDPGDEREPAAETDAETDTGEASSTEVESSTTNAESTATDEGTNGEAESTATDEVPTGSPSEDAVSASGDEPAEASGSDRPAVDAVLPDEVDADVLLTAVLEASTLFQVQRAMGKEREEVQALLAEFGLLDLVTGRVATEAEREVSREEIERRIVDRASDAGEGIGATRPVEAE
jgi:hypothetical protein